MEAERKREKKERERERSARGMQKSERGEEETRRVSLLYLLILRLIHWTTCPGRCLKRMMFVTRRRSQGCCRCLCGVCDVSRMYHAVVIDGISCSRL